MQSVGGTKKKASSTGEKASKMGKKASNMKRKPKRKLEFWAGGRGLEMQEMKRPEIK